jgi:molybdopterin-guanine dinucleotide biosynthesis protein A
MPSPSAVPAYILAGGLSSRFGSNKARALIDGRPMISRVAQSAALSARDVTVIAQLNAQYEDLGLGTIADLRPGLGPIGGIETALADALQRKCDWAFVLSVDLVMLRPHWLARLCREAAGPVQAVAFRGQYIEPLCSLYRASALEHVRRFIDGGGRAVCRLLEELKTAWIPLPADWPTLAHVNTPQELQQALQSRGP